MTQVNRERLGRIVLSLLDQAGKYDDTTGLLRPGAWTLVASSLNAMGIGTPTDCVPWTRQSAAAYYRRHLRGGDRRLQLSKRRAGSRG